MQTNTIGNTGGSLLLDHLNDGLQFTLAQPQQYFLQPLLELPPHRLTLLRDDPLRLLA